MAPDDGSGERHDPLLDMPKLADALESDRFKQFLDHIPVAIVVAQLRPSERVTYANLEFERLTGQSAADLEGKRWDALPRAVALDGGSQLSEAIASDEDYIGVFTIQGAGSAISLDAWSNIIQDDDGTPMFRLLALADIRQRDLTEREEYEQRLRDKDALMRELQHRVKNNLQLITTLIRLEARNMPPDAHSERFDRLAGRVESLSLLYRSLSEEEHGESIDFGVYLNQIASAVMVAHAAEGIRLDLQVDTWPVSIDVAMPAGLVVNELLTNSLKHAFAGRDGGTITLHSLVTEHGCRVVVADDGVGLAGNAQWPRPGSLGMLIVESLQKNAGAEVKIDSSPGNGVRVTISFVRSDVAPEMG